MNIMPWNPFQDVINTGKELSSFFPFKFGDIGIMPKMDMYQTDADVVIKAEIPGVSKEDLEVYVDENSVGISGQLKRDEQYKDENIYRVERSFGSFSRTIALPVEVKPDEVQAKYKDGVLSISIPKSNQKVQKKKKIDIN